jgi:hypothetical protein
VRWRVGLGLAMNDDSSRPPVLWDTLVPTQRLRLVRALGEMALRRILRAPIIKETSDDEQGARVEARRPAA